VTALAAGGYAGPPPRGADDARAELGVSGRLDAPELVEAINAERVILESGMSLGGAALTQEQTR